MSREGVLRNKIVANGAWLFVLQIFNTLLPLITIPYVTRVLGAAAYGEFALALNWVTYFQVVVDYGFTLTGARKVALLEDDAEGLQQLYSRIIWARIILTVLSFAFMTVMFVISRMPLSHFFYMSALYLMVIGTAFQQTWLFQGKQEMKFITLANAGARLLSVVLIFACIATPNQVMLYCVLYSITFIGSSAIGLIVAKKRYGLKIGKASIASIAAELKDGWYLFTSSAMTKIFAGIGVTVLGFCTVPEIVGAYSAVYKIPYVLTMVFAPIGQAIFPHVSTLFERSVAEGLGFMKKVAIPVMLFFVVLGVLLVALRAPLVELLFGEEYVAFANLVIPFTTWFLLSISNNFLGVQTLVGSGHQKEYSKAFAVGVVAIVILNVSMGFALGVYGVAWAATLSELVLTIALIVYAKRCVVGGE